MTNDSMAPALPESNGLQRQFFSKVDWSRSAGKVHTISEIIHSNNLGPNPMRIQTKLSASATKITICCVAGEQLLRCRTSECCSGVATHHGTATTKPRSRCPSSKGGILNWYRINGPGTRNRFFLVRDILLHYKWRILTWTPSLTSMGQQIRAKA